jgi:hypothetical protein
MIGDKQYVFFGHFSKFQCEQLRKLKGILCPGPYAWWKACKINILLGLGERLDGDMSGWLVEVR